MRTSCIANVIPRDSQGFLDCDAAKGLVFLNAQPGTVKGHSVDYGNITVWLKPGTPLQVERVDLVPGGHMVDVVAVRAMQDGLDRDGEFPIVYLKADHTIIS